MKNMFKPARSGELQLLGAILFDKRRKKSDLQQEFSPAPPQAGLGRT